MSNIDFIEESVSDKRKAESFLVVLYEHMVKYIFAGHYQDSHWITDSRNASNNLYKALYNKNTGKLDLTTINKINYTKCFNDGSDIALNKLKDDYNIIIQKDQVLPAAHKDPIINWFDINMLTNTELLGKWLKINQFPTAYQKSSISSSINKLFGI
jgi:hypothetical protein